MSEQRLSESHYPSVSPVMPRTKRWYIKESSDGRVLIFRNDEELKMTGGVDPLGSITQIGTPKNRRTCSQAEKFMETAIQVSLSPLGFH